MDLELINKIKRIAIIALASDDELMETLVLKGGNAIDLDFQQYAGKQSRASFDLDYSLVHNSLLEDEEEFSHRIEQTLHATFAEYGYTVIDYKFENRPKVPRENTAHFWGGYLVRFKIIEMSIFKANEGNIHSIRQKAITILPSHSPVFNLEFSKYEYVMERRPVDVDGYTVYVYTPEMIVFEKLRAICQQLEAYKEIVPSFSPRARARDFYDIYLIMDLHSINPQSPQSFELIQHIFGAKKVPLSFIKEIRNSKPTHVDSWKTVLDTVPVGEEVADFDFYFNFVVSTFEAITFPSDDTTSI